MAENGESPERGGPAPERLVLRTADLDEARAAIGAMFYDTRIDVLEPGRSLDAVFGMARLGPITVGDLRCGTDVRMRFGELGAHHVDLPLTGALEWRRARAGPASPRPPAPPSSTPGAAPPWTAGTAPAGSSPSRSRRGPSSAIWRASPARPRAPR
ncbi:hypothetical protein [Streptomyces sp. L2]|uniref:AraC-like ligand-binding domain-containing protein n=1 Tax=Streptomyces sp. L2 TaxID=2162665 RepID=UPI00240CED26|nr:hypothetical protein [Streptomyces sp. L2]